MEESSLWDTSAFFISAFYITGLNTFCKPPFNQSTDTEIYLIKSLWIYSHGQNIHKNVITLSGLSVPPQGPAVTGSRLSKRPLVILFTLSLEELHHPHPSSWAQDYCLVVRDTGSRHGSRTKHWASGSPFMLSHPLSLNPLSVPRGPACMSICYISVKSCRFGNSVSQQHHGWDNEFSFQ